jgi:hypothetical protein
MKLLSALVSAAACGIMGLTATPVAAQSFSTESSNPVVYSVDSLESPEKPPVNIAAEETTPSVDSLDVTISTPADKILESVQPGVVVPTAPPVPATIPVPTPAPVVASEVVNSPVINSSVDPKAVNSGKPATEPPVPLIIPVAAPRTQTRVLNRAEVFQEKVAPVPAPAAQPADVPVSSNGGGMAPIVNPLVGSAIPTTPPVSPVVTNPVIPVTQPVSSVADSKVTANVQAPITTQSPNTVVGSNVVTNPVLPVTGAADDKAAKPVSPMADTKPKACDRPTLESSIWTRAPDRGPAEYRVESKYNNPCSRTTATAGLNIASTRAIDLEITQGVGNFEITTKALLTPSVTLQTFGAKYTRGPLTFEFSRDFVEPAWNGKIGAEFEIFRKHKDPDKVNLELSAHAPDRAPMDGRLAVTYTRTRSNTKAILGANFSATGTAADLEVTQGLGAGLEVTAKAGLIPEVQLQSLGLKWARGGWSLEVKRDLTPDKLAWEGKIAYTISF